MKILENIYIPLRDDVGGADPCRKMSVNDTCAFYNLSSNPFTSQKFVLAVKITVGSTCLFSILGASLIIFTYAAFRSLRTVTRQLLVNLSVADILVAASHFVGLFTNYSRFLEYDQITSTNPLQDQWCQIQGAVTVFGSIASFLWTTAVAVYLLCIIVLPKRTDVIRLKMVVSFYLLCWGLPAIVVLVFGPLRMFGYTPGADIGRQCRVHLLYTLIQSRNTH